MGSGTSFQMAYIGWSEASMGTWTLLVKFIVFFIIPMQCYCNFSVLIFSLISDISECLLGTQSELLHVKFFEWYENHGRFVESKFFGHLPFFETVEIVPLNS